MKQIITALFLGSALAAAPASANVIKTRSAVFISKKGDGQEEKSTFRAVQHFCDNKPQCDFDVSNDWFQANDPDHQYVDLAQNQTKRLDVGYECVGNGGAITRPITYVSADEGGHLRINCN